MAVERLLRPVLERRATTSPVVVEQGTQLMGVEVKSGATVPMEAFEPLATVAKLIPELRTRLVVHGGAETWSSQLGRAVSYRELDRVEWVHRA